MDGPSLDALSTVVVSSALRPVLERWIDVHSLQSSSQYLSGGYQPMTALLRRPSLLSGPIIL